MRKGGLLVEYCNGRTLGEKTVIIRRWEEEKTGELRNLGSSIREKGRLGNGIMRRW